MRKSLLA